MGQITMQIISRFGSKFDANQHHSNMLSMMISYRSPICRYIASYILLLAACACAHASSPWWLDQALRHQLSSSIDQFAQQARGNYFNPDVLVSTQIKEGLGGAPDAEEKVDDKYMRFSAARWQSGMERAAIIVDGNKKVIAAALINYDCHYLNNKNEVGGFDAKKTSVRCEINNPRLTIFYRKHLEINIKQALVNWARMYHKTITVETRSLDRN